MTAADIVNPPPPFPTLGYPIITSSALVVALTIGLLFISARFDPTGGRLTLSLLIVLGMLATVAYCLIFTIPVDDITPSAVGALTTAFGSILSYWFGHYRGSNGGGKSPPPPPE